MAPLRVLLADDHELVRSGIRSLLEQLPGIQVVGEAANGREAVAMVAAQHPDVVLMDLTMPEMGGLVATARIVRDHPRTRVLVLSMHSDEEYVAHALKAGAVGYLLKDASSAELEIAVRASARGDRYLSPAVSRSVISGFIHGADGGSLARLSERQREVLQLIAEGRTTKDIARRLGLSVKTVEGHRTQLMKRLDVHDVPGLVRYAIRVGLVSVEPGPGPAEVNPQGEARGQTD
ncbi:MAG TPA: response regulator transcription factor [Gemmatimonadales bacterium]|nr:response regulator transcription factor [Gemmatimonadales bacterium]